MVGDFVCLIDNICIDKGDFYSYRKSRRETFVSQCQICDPQSNSTGWSVLPDFVLVPGVEPPDDCLNATDAPATPLAPTSPPVVAKTEFPTSTPIRITKNTDGDDIDMKPFGVIDGDMSSGVGSVVKLAFGNIVATIAVGGFVASTMLL